jgi:hypothetical protein
VVLQRRGLAQPDAYTTRIRKALEEQDGVAATQRVGITGTGFMY